MSRDKQEDLKVVDQFWPDLTESELSEWLSHFPMAGSFQRVIKPGGRPLASSAVVETTNGVFFVKRRPKSSRTHAGLKAEHAFISHLRESAIATPNVLTTQAGQSFLELPDAWIEAQESAAGEDLYAGRHTWQPFLNPSHGVALGRMLRQLHTASGSFQAPNVEDLGAPSGLFVMAERSLRAIGERPLLRPFLERRPCWLEELQVVAPFAEQVGRWLQKAPRVWCHGDPQANNCFWANDGVASVIDFHLSAPNPPLYDLAVALDRNCLLWLDILAGNDEAVDWSSIEALLMGYGPMGEEDANILPDLLAICQLDFSIELLEYYWHVEQSPLKATWCWEAYLIGHTAWHAGEAGQAVRSKLSQLIQG